MRKLGSFRGVYGNIDGPDLRRELPAIDTVEGGKFRIGVNHHPSDGGSPLTVEDRLKAKFSNVQAIIHGHSHKTKNELKNGILWFNPGSATGTFPARKKTYGILTIDAEITGNIVEL